jgi:ribosomal protein L17
MKKLMIIAAAAIAVSCGNKQAAQQQESDSTIAATDSVVVEEVAPENDAAKMDAKAIEKIQEFYKSYVFGNKEATDAVIKKYCTKKLAKKLAADYEYEGGGYAIWDFRSGAQDGDSDVQEVNSVEALGDGKYKVSYNDMGTKGFCVISVVVDGDNILFDEISNK